MKTLRTLRIFVAMLLLSVMAVAQAAKTPLLPETFAGWTMSGNAQTGTDPAVVDPAQAAALKEYGFKQFSRATYTNGGNTLILKAARFSDATGAYGAFTFYRQPQMRDETIGTKAVSDKDRVLFFKNDVLVEAKFDHLTAMSAAELRDLASQLPVAQGTAATLPTLPNYVPRREMVPNTGKYIVGPAAYATTGLQIPAQVVDFSHSAELLTTKMQTANGVADLVLVSYPTPQIAMNRVEALTGANPKEQNATYAVKRTGPIVAVVTGAISEQDARRLLSQVNYEAQVTWNESTGLEKRNNIGNLVIAGLTLAGIIFVFSLGSGVIFGFSRVILRKILPARFAPSEEHEKLIELRLRD